MSSDSEICPGCRVGLRRVEGPTDPYAGSSPSCWALFGEMLACEFQTPLRPVVRRSAVDAYMAQHPGYGTAAGRRSVVTHLVGLFLSIEGRIPVNALPPYLAKVFPTKADVEPLVPVPFLGKATVESVARASSVQDYATAVDAWAESVWTAWSPHHERIRQFAKLTQR